jgi:cytochrome c oxidase subunit 3
MKASITRPNHPFHLVDPSPWPAFTALSILMLFLGITLYFHKYPFSGFVLLLGLFSVLYSMFVWWRDVDSESLLGYHNPRVQSGIQLGMILFITSEAAFFVGLIWSFINAALMPTVQIGQSWPPTGIQTVEWTEVPLINTVLLASSYFSANSAQYAMELNLKKDCQIRLIITILLGILFLAYQWKEYTTASFTISDSVFGCNFYLATGFHGFHVLIGVLFLTVCLFRVAKMTRTNSLSLQLAVLYWHFVDVVWVGIYAIFYVWGSLQPVALVELCKDPACIMDTLLQETIRELFQTEPSFFDTYIR